MNRIPSEELARIQSEIKSECTLHLTCEERKELQNGDEHTRVSVAKSYQQALNDLEPW